MTIAPAADDKRGARRKATSATLTFVPFTTRKVRSVAVRVLDCSPHGLRFRSPRPLKKGQTICLHTRTARDEELPQKGSGALHKAFALAEVRWCREDTRAREGDGYTIGVRYL